MFQVNGYKRRRTPNGSMSYSDDSPPPAVRLQENRDHGMKVLSGLNLLKKEKVLCDVALIAEGIRFDAHRIILVSCSDYFRSMFTSGMKECREREIELKGVTAKGLEKVLEVIYTSTTTLESDDIFDVIAAATHLQATPVIEFCEKNFLSGMTKSNFYDFINTAKLYHMSNALKQIDAFIAQNLMAITREGTLHLLSYDQMLASLQCNKLKLREIDIFEVAWEWLQQDAAHASYAVQLMSNVRFPLISPNDLVSRIQRVEFMMKKPELREMVLSALNYHVVPHSQPLKKSADTQMRFFVERLVCVGGREIHPHPGLHDEIMMFEDRITMNSLLNRKEVINLPNALSHMQVVVFNNFLYVMGGCTTQCAHGESAVNSVIRYDPRFNIWHQMTSMINKRAYFFAGVLGNKIYAIGGKFREGSLATAEVYDPETNSWTHTQPMPSSYHAHAGGILDGLIYVCGGYSNNHFTPDMQRFNPLTRQWEDMANMLTPRGWHVMGQAGGKFFVFGGCNLNANQQALPVMQSEMYDPATDQWSAIAPLTVSHKEASCVMHQGAFCVFGGYNVQTKTGQKVVSRFDPMAGTWETVGVLPQSMTGVGYCKLNLPAYNVRDDRRN